MTWLAEPFLPPASSFVCQPRFHHVPPSTSSHSSLPLTPFRPCDTFQLPYRRLFSPAQEPTMP
eukprot:2655564-Pleurochrysis_carterae.AAC.1